jgi:predicted Rossmann fold nucleotide-binding protein DprA/Smf involved in DNA uptake
MSTATDTSLAAVLLVQRLVDVPADPLKASEYWALLERLDDPARLLDLDPPDIEQLAGVDRELAKRIAALLGAATAVAFECEELERSGIQPIVSTDDRYPRVLLDRLGSSAPPMLYVAGDPRLLTTDLLGVVGSRDVDEHGADVARGAAREASSQGFGIVSGAAKGVDRLAMTAALDAGTHAVGVLADSLTRLARDPDVRRAVTEGQLCLCTPYKPTAGFSVANAMGRNKLIYALSQATLVVASDLEKGGTWAGAVEALRRRTAPVLAWTGDGAGPGNAQLVEAGAHAVACLDQLVPLPAPHASTAELPISSRSRSDS